MSTAQRRSEDSPIIHAPRSAQTEKYVMRKANQKMLSETAAALANEPYPCRLWRMIPGEAFDESHRLAVCAYIVEFSPRDIEWRKAIAGDAACAVRIALQTRIPDEVTYPVDAWMSLLLYSALNGSAAAALVLAHLLRKMPIDGTMKNRLATSWLVRNLRISCPDTVAPPLRRSYARRSIAAQLLGSVEDPS